VLVPNDRGPVLHAPTADRKNRRLEEPKEKLTKIPPRARQDLPTALRAVRVWMEIETQAPHKPSGVCVSISTHTRERRPKAGVGKSCLARGPSFCMFLRTFFVAFVTFVNFVQSCRGSSQRDSGNCC
jgi:hypothetical protein